MEIAVTLGERSCLLFSLAGGTHGNPVYVNHVQPEGRLVIGLLGIFVFVFYGINSLQSKVDSVTLLADLCA